MRVAVVGGARLGGAYTAERALQLRALLACGLPCQGPAMPSACRRPAATPYWRIGSIWITTSRSGPIPQGIKAGVGYNAESGSLMDDFAAAPRHATPRLEAAGPPRPISSPVSIVPAPRRFHDRKSFTSPRTPFGAPQRRSASFLFILRCINFQNGSSSQSRMRSPSSLRACLARAAAREAGSRHPPGLRRADVLHCHACNCET